MSYVKHILLPSEQVLYDGHVHPTVLLPGAIMLGLSAWLLTFMNHTGGTHSLLLSFAAFLGEYSTVMQGFYYKLYRWHEANPNIALDVKVIALGLALYGFTRLSNGLITMDTTELIVTDQRIIAKTGLFTITTVEMDRRRIAGVTVHQSVAGRIMGYGQIFIQGFSSHIAGLPPMVNPHMVERFVS